jgi:twinkle protein
MQDEAVRLASIADAVRKSHSRTLDLSRWEQPKHAHLLRAPSVFVDNVMAELSDDGSRGDALPWAKAAAAFRLRPHELTVWAGSNGSAKSTLLSEVMLALAMSGRKVLIVSLEMPAYRVAAKMAAQAMANSHPTRGQVEKWAESIDENMTFLDLTGDLEPAEAIKLMQYGAHELNAQHVLLDNLTKVISADNDHAEEQRRFMARCHRTAIDTGMHVHVVAHTRKPNGEEDRPPGRYEVAGSRTLVDQPDNVVLCWRNRPKEQKSADGKLGAIEAAEQPDLILRVDKQRHGRFEGQIGLWMDRNCWRFVNEVGAVAAAYARG